MWYIIDSVNRLVKIGFRSYAATPVYNVEFPSGYDTIADAEKAIGESHVKDSYRIVDDDELSVIRVMIG